MLNWGGQGMIVIDQSALYTERRQERQLTMRKTALE
jgi:hypothetical protein